MSGAPHGPSGPVLGLQTCDSTPHVEAATHASVPGCGRTTSTEIGEWTFSNWPLYMDKKLLRAFDKQFGGKVRYLEDINDNYEFFGKVRQQLESGDSIGRDMVVLTDYMVARWIRNGWAEPIDKNNVPNAANGAITRRPRLTATVSSKWSLPAKLRSCRPRTTSITGMVAPASVAATHLASPSPFFVERAEYEVARSELRLEPRGLPSVWELARLGDG
jgi:hypothetical protein